MGNAKDAFKDVNLHSNLLKYQYLSLLMIHKPTCVYCCNNFRGADSIVLWQLNVYKSFRVVFADIEVDV